MDEVEHIFGAALAEAEKSATVPQGIDSINSPSSASHVDDPAVEGESNEPQPEPMSRLASFVMNAYRVNSDHRRESGINERLLYALNSNKCMFSDEQIAALKSTGIPESVARKLHTSITFVKTRGAKSLLVDLVSQSGDPLFEIDPSPMPDVPAMVSEEAFAKIKLELDTLFAMLEQSGITELNPEQSQILQEAISKAASMKYDEVSSEVDDFAKKRAARMQRKVWDIMLEGGWENAFADCISNLCIYGTCVIRGPVLKATERNVCRNGKNGAVKYTREVSLVPQFESVSPWDCYPAPNAKRVEDGPFCVKVRYAGHDLWRLCDSGAMKERNGEGWNDRAVKELLDRHPNGGVKLVVETDVDDAKRRELEDHGTDDTHDFDFEGVMCYAFVRGELLAEMGIVKNRLGKPIRYNSFYKVEAIVIDGLVVFCRVIDDRMGFPISKATFYDNPGSWWGDGIADKLKQVQMMQNNTAKAMFLDLAATGPMFWVRNASLLRDKSPTATQYSPYKTIAFEEAIYSPGSSAAPIGTIDIPSKAAQLIAEWDMWNSQADNDSGIPRFAEGQTAGQTGALRTSGGLMQMNENMMRGMKMVMIGLDNGIIKNVARLTADHVLVYDDDMDLKGDVYIRSIGMIGRVLKTQREQQRMQVFNMVVNNQFLLQLLGPKFVLSLFRPIVRDIEINSDDFPGEERTNFMDAVERFKQLAATQSQVNEVAAEDPAQGGTSQPQGAPPGVMQPPSPQPQGQVAERRSVA